MRILHGATARHSDLMNWMSNYSNHLDIDDRYIISSSFVAFGNMTGIGALMPFCHAVVKTNIFKNVMFKMNRNIGTFDTETVYENVPQSIMTLYAQLFACATLEGEDELSKTMTKLQGNMNQFKRSGYRGAFTHWNDFNAKLNLAEDYYPSICNVARTIYPNYQY